MRNHHLHPHFLILHAFPHPLLWLSKTEYMHVGSLKSLWVTMTFHIIYTPKKKKDEQNYSYLLKRQMITLQIGLYVDSGSMCLHFLGLWGPWSLKMGDCDYYIVPRENKLHSEKVMFSRRLKRERKGSCLFHLYKQIHFFKINFYEIFGDLILLLLLLLILMVAHFLRFLS